VPFQGKSLEIRSEPSAPVDLVVLSVFPPETPAGLIAAPAYTELGKPAVDLSWEPNVEVHIAGYKVYRRSADEPWRLLTQNPVAVAAYRDTGVTAGASYTYRVTAINDSGMESPPSAEASLDVPAR
jgi:fibronectin type 3 domain-containing protein